MALWMVHPTLYDYDDNYKHFPALMFRQFAATTATFYHLNHLIFKNGDKVNRTFCDTLDEALDIPYC